MSRQKLNAVLSAAFLVNALLIYALFYYDAPHQTLDLEVATFRGIAWDASGDRVAYFKKNENVMTIEERHLDSGGTRTIPSVSSIDTTSTVAYSQDGRYISYYWKAGTSKGIDITDTRTGTSATKEAFSTRRELLLTDNAEPKSPVIWLDDRRVIYEHTVPSGRTGILVTNIRDADEDAFIPFARRPALSPDKRHLVYVTAGKGDAALIHRMDLETGESAVLAERTNAYVHSLSWSPDGALLAVSFTENTARRYDMVAILDGSGAALVEDLVEFAAPKWLEEGKLLLTRFKAVGVIVTSKVVKGLCLFDLHDGTIRTVTRRLRSRYYYPRPNSLQVLYQFKADMELIDVGRLLEPKGIDRVRDKLGIIAK